MHRVLHARGVGQAVVGLGELLKKVEHRGGLRAGVLKRAVRVRAKNILNYTAHAAGGEAARLRVGDAEGHARGREGRREGGPAGAERLGGVRSRSN